MKPKLKIDQTNCFQQRWWVVKGGGGERRVEVCIFFNPSRLPRSLPLQWVLICGAIWQGNFKCIQNRHHAQNEHAAAEYLGTHQYKLTQTLVTGVDGGWREMERKKVCEN